jgi:hypothetical protein
MTKISFRIQLRQTLIPGQPGLHRETMSRKSKKKKKKKKDFWNVWLRGRHTHVIPTCEKAETGG